MATRQRRFGWLVGLFIGLPILFLLVGCPSPQKPAELIIGRWVNAEDSTSRMEFFKDGTMVMVGGDISVVGRYSFIADDTIRFELGGLGALVGPFVVTVSISGDTMTTTTPDGTVDRFRRAE